MNDNFIPIAEPYKRQIGNVTYIILTFGNANARLTADEMIIQMLERKILNETEGANNGEHRERAFTGEAQT